MEKKHELRSRIKFSQDAKSVLVNIVKLPLPQVKLNDGSEPSSFTNFLNKDIFDVLPDKKVLPKV